MVAETARKFESLEAQAQIIMQVFTEAGHEMVSPAVIQPANIYLDVIGETLRARSYVFTDPEGDELCLRPDLTVPTCRLHIERHRDADIEARYCYNGTAFRFQPEGADAAHPREFRQAGLESIGVQDRERAEAQTLALILEALQSVGLTQWRLRIGDLGLFRAILDSVSMPERWRKRLRHQFWRPDAFRAELHRLTTEPATAVAGLPEELMTKLDADDPQAALGEVAAYLERQEIEVIGVRRLEEITESLLALATDARSEPLSADTANLIESYVGVTAPARAAGARLKDLMRDQGVDITEALDVYHRRLKLLADAGIDIAHADFSAEFGRTLEYYTGFVFEVVTTGLGEASPVAGGGRYDDMMRMCGAGKDQPAVGAAIHTERLLSAINGDAS